MSEIKSFSFDKPGVELIRSYKYGADWPVIYLIENGKDLYVGETIRVHSRAKEHLDNPMRRILQNVHIISDDEYNKSATLDTESSLIEYFAADGKFKLQNGNSGLQNHDFFDREKYQGKFEVLWRELQEMDIAQKNLLEIKNSDLFKYSPYKSLTEEQYSFVKNLVTDIDNKRAKTYVVEGAPGTGKTILATYLMKYLMDHKSTKNLKVALVAPMSNLRTTIRQVFCATSGLKAKMVIGPNDVAKEEYDLVIVDEAHRLKKRKNLGVAFKAFDITSKKLGLPKETTQLDWILSSTKQQILFYDQGQSVLPADIDDVDLRSRGASFYKLTKQMRIQAGDKYIHFIDSLLNQKEANLPILKNYELRIFDDVAEMHRKIKARDKEDGLCRMVAGFAWPWVTNPANGKPKQDYDIEINNYKLSWNSKTKNWVNSPNAVNEVGCIHTVQGYGMNYVGVIVGPELFFEESTGKISVDRSKYSDRNGHAGVTDPKELERYIINIYRTLLTRGIKGTYIYIVDENLRNYFKEQFKKGPNGLV
ncbi:DUF2075 domain-containing protein [Patescibacteria group bacterium]|nr:DUF2075 domain-containing protein [Patescibacteria group bacterium]